MIKFSPSLLFFLLLRIDLTYVYAKIKRISLYRDHQSKPAAFYTKLPRPNYTSDYDNVFVHFDSTFYATVMVGTPPQSFKMLVVSYHPDIWVPSTRCTAGCEGRRLFDMNASSTYQSTNTIADIIGFDLEAFCWIGRDRICIGNVCVRRQKFGAVYELNYPEPELSYAYDGLFGLGFSVYTDLEQRYSGFLDTLQRQNPKTARLYGIWLSPSPQYGKPDAELTIGAVDKRRYIGELNYTDVEMPDWTVAMAKVTVNPKNTRSESIAFDSRYARITFALSGILAPDENSVRFNEYIGAKPVPFNRNLYFVTNLPDLVFHIGGVEYTLGPRDYTVERLLAGMRTCYSVVTSTDVNDGIWYLGEAFIRRYFTVYDMDNARVGLAPAEK